MEDFIFDLQRFATTWTLTSKTDNGTTTYTLESSDKKSKLSASSLTELLTKPDDAIAKAQAQGSTTKSTVTSVAKGDTIKLGDAITDKATWTISKDITLDLNGKTFTAPASAVGITIDSGKTLTLKDSGSGGKITGTGSAKQALVCVGTDTGKATLIMQSGTIDVTTTTTLKAYGVQVLGGSTFTMSGGNIKTAAEDTIGVAVGKQEKEYKGKGDTFNMSGRAKIESAFTGVRVYNGGGKFNMSGGTITGSQYGVGNSGNYGYDATTITISDGKITCTKSSVTEAYAQHYGRHYRR